MNPSVTPTYSLDESAARELDQADPLADYRARFHIPKRPDGVPVVYLCGNSLGLQPVSIRAAILQELDDWANLAVDAHFAGAHPWYPYHEFVRNSVARLVGARAHEVVMMNGLTVNLHLLMASFYRPTSTRFKILMEDTAFPSDTYAAQTQLRFHGFDPKAGIVVARPRANEHQLRTEDILALIEREGDAIALVLFGAVNYFTGQVFDMARITAAAQAKGCVVGFDCAHGAGNVPLKLHDANVDFAAWCSYKYLNSGPGSVAGAFVHERHVRDTELVRFGGWWGNDPDTRFRMHLNETFVPVASADAWQLSNPPILSMAAVRASLELFDEVGMPALREKSQKLTAYLHALLEPIDGTLVDLITPSAPEARGCQLSLRVKRDAKAFQESLQQHGFVTDFRPPNIVRIAPVPLYNTFHEVWQFAFVLREHLA